MGGSPAVGSTDGYSNCFGPGWNAALPSGWTGQNRPDALYRGNDRLAYFTESAPADFILDGMRLEVHFIRGARVVGNVVCAPGARDAVLYGPAANSPGGVFVCD